MLEREFQAALVKRLERMFPGCLVLKQDPTLVQGIPDLLILHRNRWAALEVKPYEGSTIQPNQDWYIERMDAMSFAAFIYPENEEDILHALQQAL